MATGEDRPIVVTGGSEMATVTVPEGADGGKRTITVKALEGKGPFTTMEFTEGEKSEPEFSIPLTEKWTITIK